MRAKRLDCVFRCALGNSPRGLKVIERCKGAEDHATSTRGSETSSATMRGSGDGKSPKRIVRGSQLSGLALQLLTKIPPRLTPEIK